MGCGESKHGDVTPSKQVDDELEECRRNSHYHSKVLLLGAGESGKSTFGKQLKMLAKGKLSVAEMALYRRGETAAQRFGVSRCAAGAVC
ncbi:unnamed protein product [Ectocarpus sp. CCAP 1310/34]|nr:unnamed protein product [Ectocarpus sp. CCAP 1310/34]